MSLIQALKEILGLGPDTSAPEEEGLPEALGPTARQYVYADSLPERFEPADKLEVCISVRRDAPDRPATETDMAAVKQKIQSHNLRIETEDRSNALFVVSDALDPDILTDIAEHEAVVSMYIAREWGGE